MITPMNTSWPGRGWMLAACLLVPGMAAAEAAAGAATACDVGSEPKLTPLVELYTSEGCSDCPPADDWLSTLAREEDPARISLLAFHVDYWDEIGWIDRFADPAYSQRQRVRVKLDEGRTVYTPQVMVGDKTMLDWRDDRRARAVLRGARETTAPVSLLMRVVVEDSRLRVGVKAEPAAGATAPGDGPTGDGMLWLALYQDGLSTEVRAGENDGLTLHHDRVVRALKGPWAVGHAPVIGETSIELPEGADPRRLGLVLFAESTRDGSAWQSLNMPLADCIQ
ncbi:DUF1223 domain-containing protein [Marilutibacter chinensis]|uniref:DUF1223 domain-containing protein n=1 Tax=Marilutibacter chinensis TaxID=2912247 RepID=A0ABS9HNR7_9GAMM|nr:DUF1223 domain-containing protein [Lysobacter chinensis]MCF7220629.1 DUF1223 domain-containing protein [Lysobacter chinensis]